LERVRPGNAMLRFSLFVTLCLWVHQPRKPNNNNCAQDAIRGMLKKRELRMENLEK